MFVLASTYNKLLRSYDKIDRHNDQLLAQYNDLVRRIQRGEFSKSNSPFSNDEIKTLIVLCHPDKHGGKDTAVKMTQKLLGMRK